MTTHAPQIVNLRFRPGTIVEFLPGPLMPAKYLDRAWKVVKDNKQHELVAENGEGCTAHPSLLKRSDLPFVPTSKPVTASLGVAVRFKQPSKNTDTLVIIAIKNGGATANLAKLGGDGNRYYRGIPLERLEEVDPRS